MRVDQYGQLIYSEDDLCDIVYKDPSKQLKTILVDQDISISDDLGLNHKPNIIKYIDYEVPVEQFDDALQSLWFMPESYKEFDIAKYVLDLCSSDEELQRVGKELIMFQERNMFDMLRYLKYLVDTMRNNNIVWGVGRGSSVASFVLFLIGVHRINSLYYDLPIEEFLK